MNQQQALDLLDRLSPEEITVFFYRYILGLSDTEIVDCRWRYKLTYLDCHKTINRIVMKKRKNGVHDDLIVAIQEVFANQMEQGLIDGKQCNIC